MSIPFVAGITGAIGSGKDTVAGMLSEVLCADVEVISFSRLLIDEKCTPFGIAPTRENLQRIGLETPAEWFHERAAARMEASPKTAFAIPNVRRHADAAFVRRCRYQCLIGVETSASVAFARARKRAVEQGSDLTLAEFRRIREAPIESEIPALIALADIRLDNDGTLDDLRRALFGHRQELRYRLNRAVLCA